MKKAGAPTSVRGRTGTVGRPTIDVQAPDDLVAYSSIPIRFLVDRRLDIGREDGIGAFQLAASRVDPPVLKDYDSETGHHPTTWAERFDLSPWAMLVARLDGSRVGGALVAFGCRDLDMLEGRTDLAVLWDIRVHPDRRGIGIGSALFESAARWAAARGCRELKVETQDINYPACRFYAARGCELRSVERDAYPELPDEAQLLWYLDLSSFRARGAP